MVWCGVVALLFQHIDLCVHSTLHDTACFMGALRRTMQEEKERSLSDYMALPPSQYSVLDGSKIVRLTDDTFRCEMDTISFFGYSVKPILTAKVELRERGCCITVVGAKILGNSVVEKANDNFVRKWNAFCVPQPHPEQALTRVFNVESALFFPPLERSPQREYCRVEG